MRVSSLESELGLESAWLGPYKADELKEVVRVPPILSVLSVIGLFALGGGVVAQFWSSVTKGLAQDEASVYGESLKAVFLER